MTEPNKLNLILTRPALDRLLGGDDQLTVEIKHAAAREILDKHIVPLMDNSALYRVKARLQEHTTKILDEELGEYEAGTWNKASKFKPSVKVQDSLNALVRSVAQNVAADAVKKVESDIATIVEREVQNVTKVLIRSLVKTEIDAAIAEMTAKLKTNLKLDISVKQ